LNISVQLYKINVDRTVLSIGCASQRILRLSRCLGIGTSFAAMHNAWLRSAQ